MIHFIRLVILCLFAITQVSAGTFCSWMQDGAPSDGSAPWGNRTVANSHPTKDLPDTGVTRYYDLHVARKVLAPDGVEQSMIVVNGQYPGPLLEANWGDWFEITVHNDIYAPEEGTSMHWHGFKQVGTQWYDGTPVIGQCPIAPGSSLTYRFRADEFGTGWYHAHFSAQYSSGVTGAMVVYGPSHVTYDEDLEPILISDWYHEYYTELVDQVVQTGVTDPTVTRPRSVSNLVQGLGVFPCAKITNGAKCTGGSYTSLNFEPGKTYRLRLVNAGAVAFEQISLDGHTMTVIANDFVEVEPYQTQIVTLGVGQRTDVLVTATGQPGRSYWFRAWNHPQCGDTDASDGRAIIYYPGANKNASPTSIATPLPPNSLCQNDDLSLTKPIYQIPVKRPELTLTITLTNGLNASGSVQWYMNSTVFKGNFNSPLLLDAVKGQTEFGPQSVVYNTGSKSSIRIIFQNTFIAPHPMHQHGHDFLVLAEGRGTWDSHIINPSNPQRRDVHMNWAGADASKPSIGPNYMVIQYDLDNPGVWPFHCHIAWHLSAGMLFNFLEQPAQLVGLQPPQAIQDTCASWDAWTAVDVVEVNDATREVMLKEKRRSKVDWAMDDATWLAHKQAMTKGRLVRRQATVASADPNNDR